MAARKDERQLMKKLSELAATKDACERLVLAEEVRRLAVELQHESVGEARRAGLTWTQIGAMFGMTKQAAQQRFKDSPGTKGSG